MNLTDKLAAALRASVKSVEYSAMVLQAPDRCAMREDLANARQVLAEYDAAKCSPPAVLAAALLNVDEACQEGLNSDDPAHWQAALQDVLRIARDALGVAE